MDIAVDDTGIGFTSTLVHLESSVDSRWLWKPPLVSHAAFQQLTYSTCFFCMIYIDMDARATLGMPLS